MSAFVPSKVHYDLLVKTMMEGLPDIEFKYRYWEPLGDSYDELGELLLRETVRSVRYRYGKDTDMVPGWAYSPYTYTDPGVRLTAIEFIKAIQCYRYQSCEHPKWKNSTAEALTREALFRAALKLVSSRMEDEFEEAPWDWTEEELAKKIARSES